jgi:hypothetical protein
MIGPGRKSHLANVRQGKELRGGLKVVQDDFSWSVYSNPVSEDGLGVILPSRIRKMTNAEMNSHMFVGEGTAVINTVLPSYETPDYDYDVDPLVITITAHNGGITVREFADAVRAAVFTALPNYTEDRELGHSFFEGVDEISKNNFEVTWGS